MGCIHSTPRPTITPSPVLVAEDEKSQKVFDSRSLSSKSPSSPKSSVEIKSPILSIILPSPPISPPKCEVQAVETTPAEPDLSTDEINNDIQSLLTAITEYDSLATESREKISSELNAILELVSENTLVYTKLEILTSHITTFYHNQQDISTNHLQPLLTSLPSAWNTFLSLPLDEQRYQAETQPHSSSIMEIFTGLVEARKRCEVSRKIDEKVAKRMSACFEEVLRELKIAGPEEAAMKWKVLGTLGMKRRVWLEEIVLEILRVRMRVSKGMMEVVEVLGECE